MAPSGIHRYRNSTLGDNFRNDLFSAQFNTHRVLRHKLHRDGGSFRTDDDIFFSSDDEDLHPTDVLEDGDGSLLVVETGGWFIKGCPLSQVSKPDLQGAIYRIRRTDAKKVEDAFGNAIDWSSLTAEKAATYLADPRPFVRDRAVNRLVDHGRSAIPVLADLLGHAASPDVRVRAVFSLYRINTSEAFEALRMGLDDSDLQVRIAAARAAGLARDEGSIERLVAMAGSDEPAARRQAATALGQIGNPRVIPSLLQAAIGVRDRFVEHAITYALIAINEPAAVSAGLADGSADVRRTALIALDQMSNNTLQADHLDPFLMSNDSALQQTALWVASHHPEWAGRMARYLGTELAKSSWSEEKKKLLHDLLVSFCGDHAMQEFIAQQFKAATNDRKLFLLDAMAACDAETFPENWAGQLGNALTGSSHAGIQQKAMKLIQLRGISSVKGPLQQAASDTRNPPMVRITAIGVLLDSDSLLSESHFNYLYEQLQPGKDAPIQQQAASVLGKGSVTHPQRVKLAHFLNHADGFLLPRLLPVFDGPGDLETGEALATALLNTPSLDNFTETGLRKIFAGYPNELQSTVDKLVAKLNVARNERLSRIQEIEKQISLGDIEKGRALFFGKAICYTCHAIGNEGGRYGPDLTSIQRDRSAHDLVEAIVYPGVSFVREYETYEIKTPEGTYTGIIQEQSDEVTVLGISPQESIRITRDKVLSTEIKDVSMMPQGLDRLLTEQEMADLMAFLMGQDQDPETDAVLLR